VSVREETINLPGRWSDPGFHLHTYQAGDGPAVVLCHGFPDIALGWHRQLPALAEAGYRAIAPDMRGFGRSSCPDEIAAYSMGELTGDLIALLDALEIERAVFVGHDWGGFIAWALPLLYPERVAGIVGVCTPYMPFPSTEVHLGFVDGVVERQYVAWFQEPGVAEQYMDEHVEAIVTRIMRTAPPLEVVLEYAFADGKLTMNPFLGVEDLPLLGEPLLSEDHLAAYIEAFSRSGFRGGINWYRNIDNNLANHPDVGVKPIDLPCLMFTAANDPALRPELAADMPERCSDLEMHLIEDAGHWVQQEQPGALNKHLLDWLARRFPTKG